MKKTLIIGVGFICVAVTTSKVSAQLSGTAKLDGGLSGGAAAASAQRTQAQAQQRIQTQIQARAQTQVQQQAMAQAQARLQADAARAAGIAHAAAAAARRQAQSAKQQLGRPRVEADARVKAGASAQAGDGTFQSQADVHARLGVEPGLHLPQYLTAADVAIYDDIFGRFNPLRPRPEPAAEPQPQPPASGDSSSPNNPPKNPSPPTASNSRPQSSAPGQTRDGTQSPAPDEGDGDAGSQPQPERRGLAYGHLDLASRIALAVSERRAEISQFRDRAFVTSDVELMMRAERMEEALDAFVAAQRKARSQTEATSTPRPNGRIPPANQVQVEAGTEVQGQIGPRTAQGPQSSPEGTIRR